MNIYLIPSLNIIDEMVIFHDVYMYLGPHGLFTIILHLTYCDQFTFLFRNHETGFLATASGDNSLRLFSETADSDTNAPSFQLIVQEQNAHLEDVNSIDWNPKHADMLASASDDGTVKIWRYSSEV